MKTVVKMLRKDGMGVQGSIKNAVHHAPLILDFIKEIEPHASKLGFATWKQGHNVHEFVTEDGDRYTLRAFSRGRKDGIVNYVGVRLSLRVSRSLEHRLIDIESLEQVPALLETMRLLAIPNMGDVTGVMMDKAA